MINEFKRAAWADTLRKPVTAGLEEGDPRRALRAASPAWHVELKAIGSWDNPGRYGDLLLEVATERLRVEAEARGELVRAGRLTALQAEDPDTAATRLNLEVSARVNAHAGLQELAARNNRTILCEGLVGGEEEVQRLFKLGGGKLLRAVLEEIHAYHTLDFETGEG